MIHPPSVKTPLTFSLLLFPSAVSSICLVPLWFWGSDLTVHMLGKHPTTEQYILPLVLLTPTSLCFLFLQLEPILLFSPPPLVVTRIHVTLSKGQFLPRFSK